MVIHVKIMSVLTTLCCLYVDDINDVVQLSISGVARNTRLLRSALL